MSTDKPETLAFTGEGLTVGVIAARYNGNLVDALLERVIQTLTRNGVEEEEIEVYRVPGSNEIPYAASMAAKSGEFDVLICLGLIIEGDTDHHAVIAAATAGALQDIAIQFETPLINGIITVRNEEQARQRITGPRNRGEEFARAAIEMAAVGEDLRDQVTDAGLDLDFEDMDWLDEFQDNIEDFDDGEDKPK